MSQGDRQSSFRAIGSTTGSYAEDARAAFEAEVSVPAGVGYNAAFILWLQGRLSSSATNINDLLAEWAAAESATNASAIGSFDPSS